MIDVSKVVAPDEGRYRDISSMTHALSFGGHGSIDRSAKMGKRAVKLPGRKLIGNTASLRDHSATALGTTFGLHVDIALSVESECERLVIADLAVVQQPVPVADEWCVLPSNTHSFCCSQK